jgi:Ser/Thr protein kinase RdoA (MazF antagonist)
MPRFAACVEAAGATASRDFLHDSCCNPCPMNARLQDVLQRLSREDPLRLVETCQVEWDVEQLQERRYSAIYLLRAARGAACVQRALGTPEIVLKLYRAVEAPRRQKEFDDLCRVHEALSRMQLTPVGVPRPIAAFADLGAVLTARAPGSSAVPQMRAACRRRGSLELLAEMGTVCSRMGAWLREFQRVGSRRAKGQQPRFLGTPDGFVAYVDERLRLLTGVRPGIDVGLRTQAQDVLRRVLERVDPYVFRRVTWSHSDFGPHNVLVHAGGLTLLDFELGPEHPYFDAAYCMESIAGMHGPWVDGRRVARLQSAFLDAYGTPEDIPLFQAFRLRHLACSYVSESRRSGSGRVRAWPGLMRLRSRLARTIADLRSSAGSIVTSNT